MTKDTELQTVSGELVNMEDYAMTTQQIVKQVTLIQDVMRKVMTDGEHYGVIPGTSKPSLLKPGAEKLCLLFRLRPQYEILDMIKEDSFILYTIKCLLVHIPTGNEIAEGLGSCNSHEKKYRYYSENTRDPVPKEYWKHRDSKLIGGEEYTPRKIDGNWVIFRQYENPNPYDLDNTLLKMGCKRALVAAILNGTAASDIFTQDVEDMPAEALGGQIKKKADQGKKKEPVQREPERKGGEKATEKQIGAISKILDSLGFEEENHIKTISEFLKITLSDLSDLTKEQASACIKSLQEEQQRRKDQGE
ncbi:MAG: hypothetical protein U9N38_04960 [Thermodesulfobacteriota bacterium]|nr:hypothetical protein [Thermodesulfobacteriota bacterium]